MPHSLSVFALVVAVELERSEKTKQLLVGFSEAPDWILV